MGTKEHKSERELEAPVVILAAVYGVLLLLAIAKLAGT